MQKSQWKQEEMHNKEKVQKPLTLITNAYKLPVIKHIQLKIKIRQNACKKEKLSN